MNNDTLTAAQTTPDSDFTSIYGEPISVYTRQEAFDDGELVDVSEWAGTGPEGMLGGFRYPVAFTRALWADMNDIPARLKGLQDVRGRAHDVLSLAAMRARFATGDRFTYTVSMEVESERRKNRTLLAVCGPDDDGQPCITIGYPSDF